MHTSFSFPGAGRPTSSRKTSSSAPPYLDPFYTPTHSSRTRHLHLFALIGKWTLLVFLAWAVLDSTSRLAGEAFGAAPTTTLFPSRWALSRALQSFKSFDQARTGGGHIPARDAPLPWSAEFPNSIASISTPHISRPSLQHVDSFSMEASRLYAKAFGRSLQPTQIVPFFYRASGERGRGFEDTADITVTSMITEDRLDALVTLVERYQGPISVVVSVSTSPSSSPPADFLASLHALYTGHPLFARFVDVHLLLSPHPRQFNLQRNIARFFARTEFILMLDIDFTICSDFRSRITGKGGEEVRALLRSGTAALVVPAFEYVNLEEGKNVDHFPTDKTSLLRLVEEGRLDVFHKSWAPGHSSTNYTAFYSAPLDSIYRVTTYQHSYEPYVILPRDGPPFCDERFVGYGVNKAACLYEMHLSGIEFYVLGGDWVVHRTHAYAEIERKQERKHNRVLYTAFRSEICHRYLLEFLQHRGLDTSRAKPLLRQCRKIDGFVAAAKEWIRVFKSITPKPLLDDPSISLVAAISPSPI